VPAGWDVWTPLMSLPHLCHLRPDTPPASGPYLRADVQRQAAWRERLQQEHPTEALRIGLVWRGNPQHENDAQRSLPHLRALAALADVAGIRCYSLQSGAGADDVDEAPPGLPLARLDAPLGDFAQTAALVTNLDLVIGVDTSVVHLAGALGVPVWVLLSQHKPDWRWLDGRSDSPWYPGVMRLFRQPAAGDWAGVMSEVVRALSGFSVDGPHRAQKPLVAETARLPAMIQLLQKTEIPP
jgi:ADP-heptose:LPS heptosyltransferase